MRKWFNCVININPFRANKDRNKKVETIVSSVKMNIRHRYGLYMYILLILNPMWFRLNAYNICILLLNPMNSVRVLVSACVMYQ